MGIFQSVMSWLTEKSNHAVSGQGGFSQGQEAAQGYSHYGTQESEGYDENAETSQQLSSSGYFGTGADDYDGRVRYQSKEDHARDEQMRRQKIDQQQNMAMNTQQMNAVQMPQMNSQQQTQSQMIPQQAPQQGYVQREYQAPTSNVVPFPGTQQSEGTTYSHVEYVILLRGRNECKNVITHIKSNASVFLNMEFIASDNERQRCVDILSGAAYTLGCTLNKISQHGIYLISSPAVQVIMDPTMTRMNSTPDARSYARQQQSYQNYQGQQDMEPAQEQQHFTRQQQRYQAQEQMNYEQQRYAQQNAGSSFSSGSPTTRFQEVHDMQQPDQSAFRNMMAGNPVASGETAARY
ncbi:MAG: cell division protein SepF [Clostridiales bacterium]|nr:cell division protein SepF [Clostridiales bacterium]